MKKETQKLLEFVDELEKKSPKNLHNDILHLLMRANILYHENRETKKVKKSKKPKTD